ncbi:MAG TPA: hypothetical protein ENI03_00645, partial [Thermodesulfobacterium geofontis]|nr:hypothetical protein [Thermodesulfobacterium geofontis]
NNNGLAATPRIVNYLQDAKGNQYKLDPKLPDTQAVSKKSANQIKDILQEVVSRGTGKKAQYPGLEVGGKTGTAHIAKNGRYVREYHSSFYGFANDKKGHKYTIGALVIRAKKYRHYFASKSAVPTFRRMIDILVDLDYLEPEEEIEVPLAPIKIDKPLNIESTPQLIVHPEVIKKSVVKEPVKVRKSSVQKLFQTKKPKPKPVLTEKKTKKLNANKRKKGVIKEDKISEDEILKEKLAKIESKMSEKGAEPDYSLSEEEIKELEKKLLAFQKRTHLNNTRTGDHFGEALGVEYLFLIKRKLQNNFEVPIYLRSQKDLYAVVNIELSSEGKILHYKFLKKSSNSEFNKAVEKCLKVSSPLPVNRSLKLIVEFKSEGIGKIK